MKLILIFCATILVLAQAATEKKLICYWQSWSVYRPGDGLFDPSFVDAKLCTHLVYTFVGLTEKSEIVSLDAWKDFPGGINAMSRFNQLREQNPQLKTLVAVGGWNQGSGNYSKTVSNVAYRNKFVESAVAFIKRYGFNGLDFDWEYPNQRGGSSPADKENFVLLLKQLRERFDKEGLILSAALGVTEEMVKLSYNIPEISKYLHLINLMAYNLHGTWDKRTGMNAALYPTKWETGVDAKLNVESVIKYWLSHGAAAEKIIVGIALYGRSFTLKNTSLTGVGVPATAGRGPFSGESGILSYNDICLKIKNENWKVIFDEKRRVPYAYSGDQWVSYDNVQSVREKVNLIKKYNLGGAFAWSIETDDFRGKCGEKFPLVNAIKREFATPGFSKTPEFITAATSVLSTPTTPVSSTPTTPVPSTPTTSVPSTPTTPEQSSTTISLNPADYDF